eukprot:CAMPEP_0198364888 /NCGR_PEP_ID=MMETSP1450-20131203/153893_1 /TAXON_ID=753684 ORGANISM="Madagascaria erythrocladiodes, Strain CCMP3234" /NCGR_SAMPLE_ID=MMETSP1450 /ASSEMBLY_ACC=CAM_ASM_001115 /LENGTH=458 /DNA_ID=CAMNT_0044072329 /DNA_START=190 /DNA_END=1564 /DNA_ORIENTATION=-
MPLTEVLRAAKFGNAEALRRLLPDDVNTPNDDGETPLIMASRHGRIECLKLLISAGAKLNVQNKWGNTAFYYAVVTSRGDIIAELVAAGADATIRNNKGLTPREHGVNMAAPLALPAALAARDTERTAKEAAERKAKEEAARKAAAATTTIVTIALKYISVIERTFAANDDAHAAVVNYTAAQRRFASADAAVRAVVDRGGGGGDLDAAVVTRENARAAVIANAKRVVSARPSVPSWNDEMSLDDVVAALDAAGAGDVLSAGPLASFEQLRALTNRRTEHAVVADEAQAAIGEQEQVAARYNEAAMRAAAERFNKARAPAVKDVPKLMSRIDTFKKQQKHVREHGVEDSDDDDVDALQAKIDKRLKSLRALRTEEEAALAKVLEYAADFVEMRAYVGGGADVLSAYGVVGTSRSVADYDVVRELGGGHSTVLECTRRADGARVALKRVPLGGGDGGVR